MKVLESPRRTGLLIIGIWLIITLLGLFCRYSITIDETRYLSVAWEMWLRGDWLVPHLNGEPYHHKPPLLFWLINLTWSLFGVHEWAARLIPALTGIVGVLLAIPLSTLLWPGKPRLASLATWSLFTLLFWGLWTTAVMFDLLVAVCAEVALLGIVLAWRGFRGTGWLITGVGIGLGILAKGPVIFVYVLPVVVLAPLWIREQRPNSWLPWYGGGIAAIVLAALIGLSWAIPAAIAGGESYANHILWGQTTDRIVRSFAHRRPFWWYLPLLPLLLFPWSLWPPLWRGIRERWREGWDSGERLALIAAIAGLGIFSLISGKQVHYLLPIVPFLALFAAQALDRADRQQIKTWFITLPLLPLLLIGFIMIILSLTDILHGHAAAWADQLSPWGGVLIVLFLALAIPASRWLPPSMWPGLVSLLFLGAAFPGSLGEISHHYAVNEIATIIAAKQRQGRTVAVFDKYHGEFNFAGRLEQPIEEIGLNSFDNWRARHPDGLLVVRVDKQPAENDTNLYYWQHYRSSFLELRDADSWWPKKTGANF